VRLRGLARALESGVTREARVRRHGLRCENSIRRLAGTHAASRESSSRAAVLASELKVGQYVFVWPTTSITDHVMTISALRGDAAASEAVRAKSALLQVSAYPELLSQHASFASHVLDVGDVRGS
jgi:hypothetical protein